MQAFYYSLSSSLKAQQDLSTSQLMNVYEMLPNVYVCSGCYNKTDWRGLDKRLFLTVLEAGNSEIKAPADLVSGEHSSSQLADGGLLDVSLHGRQRKSSGLVSSYKGTYPFTRAHYLIST